MICPNCQNSDVTTERRPDGYCTCLTCRHKWRTVEAETWALRERVKELEAKLAERDVKPDNVPTPEDLIASWLADLGPSPDWARARGKCADELHVSLKAHQLKVISPFHPLARDLTREELERIALSTNPFSGEPYGTIAELVRKADQERGLRP